MELREYDLCTAVAVPSLFVERSFVERGFPRERLHRNALGVNQRQFQPPVHPPAPPNKSSLHVIYAGSLSIQKGVHDLLEGFSAAKLPDARLTLVGGKTPQLTPLIDRQSNCIRCLGHRPQSELIQHYGLAHCFVMASIQEGMAMVQLQALACGLPLICTTNTGGEDLLRLGGEEIGVCTLESNDSKGHNESRPILEFSAGWVIPINSPQAIAFCLNRLASEPGLWEEKRKQALALAQSTLSWASYGERAISHYRSLLAHGRAGATP
jgi:glycosyltransferase involved in cell wall biosynthesis